MLQSIGSQIVGHNLVTQQLVAQRLKRLPLIRDTWVRSMGWEDPLEKEMATHSLQYCCLENPMDKGAWQATVCRVAQLDWTTSQLLYRGDSWIHTS